MSNCDDFYIEVKFIFARHKKEEGDFRGAHTRGFRARHAYLFIYVFFSLSILYEHRRQQWLQLAIPNAKMLCVLRYYTLLYVMTPQHTVECYASK